MMNSILYICMFQKNNIPPGIMLCVAQQAILYVIFFTVRLGGGELWSRVVLYALPQSKPEATV